MTLAAMGNGQDQRQPGVPYLDKLMTSASKQSGRPVISADNKDKYRITELWPGWYVEAIWKI